MLATVAAAAVVCAASVVIGQALLGAAGWRAWSPLAAGVGFAALLVVCGLGGRALALVVAVLAAAAYLAVNGGRQGEGPRGVRELLLRGGSKSPTVWLGAALIAAAAAAIPFLVNDRVGILGVGLVNDDMANHLLMADWAQNGTEPRPELIDDGYPLGPHSLAATLADLLGIGLVEAFAGLTLAIAAITAITALAALDRLPPLRRALAAALAALPYLGAAYLAQGAFKEPIQALLLVTFVLLLARSGRKPSTVDGYSPHVRNAIAIAVVVAAAVYNYSFPGLFWLGAAAALFVLLKPNRRATVRALVRPAAAMVALALLLTLPEWGRIVDFTGFGAFDPAGEQTGLGNLRQAISPLEALGVWPSGEFRLAPADASIPALAFYLGGLLGAAAVGYGIAVAVRRRRDDADGIALVAAFAGAVVIYAGAALAGTPYTSAKALAIAAVPAMLVALRALLSRALPSLIPRARRPRALGAAALAAAFAVAAAGSTFLALRQAPVSPAAHADELAEIRPLVAGDPVLFLGRDDFIAWHLRGAPVFTHIQNFFSTGRVPARVDPEDGEKFDFDAVSARTLDRFDWVLTSSSAYASEPPASFEEAKRTPSYVLWRRTGSTEERSILAEGTAPGAVAACPPVVRAKRAAVWPVAPAEGGEEDWRPAATLEPGQTARQSLELGRGTVEVSLAYDSPHPLELRVSSGERAAQVRELPANLDFRGPTPPFPAGPPLELDRRGSYEVEVSLAEAPLAGRLLGAEGEAHLRDLFAVETGSPPVARAGRICGSYVDWYAPAGRP